VSDAHLTVLLSSLVLFCEDLRALINAVIVVMLNGRLAGKG